MHDACGNFAANDVFASGEYQNASALFAELHRLGRMWAAARPKPPLRRGDLAALGTVAHMSAHGGGPVTMGSLATRMNLSLPGASQKVSELEKLGLARRVPGKEDRRVVCIQLTPKGRRMAGSALKAVLSRAEAALGVLGEEKTHTFLSLAHELSDIVDNLQPPPE